MKKLIVALLGLAAGLGSQVAAQGGVERIAYDQCYMDYWFSGEVVCYIAVVDVDTSNTIVVIEGGGAVWSPDGSRMAFAGPVFPGEVSVLNLGDGTVANLTNHPASDGPAAWSPDGARIAFWSDRGGATELYVMSADGSGALRLAGYTAFRWSPDGGRIAFNCVVESANVDICLINADGTGLVRLTTDPAVDADPTWSPDGSRIGFWSNRGGARELYVMDAGGSGVTQLTDNVGVNGMPAWSPDGGRIAFSCVVESPNRDICAINADATGFRRLTSAPEDEYFAAWSPSGSRIAFAVPFEGLCSDFCEDDIYLMNADGTGRRWFARGHNPVWTLWTVPIAAFQYGCSGPMCAFDASGSSDNGTITSHAWDFGDGTTGTGLTVSHTFAPGRTYTVTLTVTDNDGLTGTKSEIVDLNERPAASFTSACHGFTCTADGSASWDPDGAITSLAWDFGDGTTGSGATVSHPYAAPGVYTITLTVTDNGGATGTQSRSVSVNAPPVASSTSTCNGLTCNFSGSGSSDPDGTITSYAWTFGDGMTASGPTVSHTYVAAAIYTVTLTVTDNGGSTGTQSQSVTVSQAHVADLDRASTSQSGSWTAIVTIAVHDSSHSPVASATVSGSWSNGGTGSCMTNSGGQCTMSKAGIPKKTGIVKFAVVNVIHPTLTYAPAANHDPEGDSNGTSITVSRP